MNRLVRRFLLTAACLTLAALPLFAANKEDSFTPMPLDSGFGPMDLRTPAMATSEIIRQFAEKESQFRHALNNYTYRRVARVQEIDEDKKVTGEYYEVDDVVFDSTGRRTEKVVYAPQNSLKQVMLMPSDLEDIQKGYSFVLTSEEIQQYTVEYVGRQKVDELDCYVFNVEPKNIEKKKRYFSGRIWVDATDLQIVVTSGRMLPNGTKKGEADLHPPFMTWRGQIDGHYWFPIYTRGEGILHFAGGYGAMAQDVHLRETIKYSDYKQFGSTVRILSSDELQLADPDNAPKPQPQQQAPAKGGKK